MCCLGLARIFDADSASWVSCLGVLLPLPFFLHPPLPVLSHSLLLFPSSYSLCSLPFLISWIWLRSDTPSCQGGGNRARGRNQEKMEGMGEEKVFVVCVRRDLSFLFFKICSDNLRPPTGRRRGAGVCPSDGRRGARGRQDAPRRKLSLGESDVTSWYLGNQKSVFILVGNLAHI